MYYIQNFLETHPLYKKIAFSDNTCSRPTHLHPILSASQAIIDSFLASGQSRIAVVLPDDDTNVLPLVVAKYLSNVQERPDYAHSVFEDIEAGQHLKLGKAVVEYVSIDNENNRIAFVAGKPKKRKFGNSVYYEQPITYYTPIHSYYLYFERSNGALSKETTFCEERKKIKKKLDEDGMVDIDLLAMKRTVLNKTIAVLSYKNEFKNYLSSFSVSERDFSDVVTYGEFDDSSENGYSIFNTGKLDCLPGLLVSGKIHDLSVGITKSKAKGRVEAIVVTQSKYGEVINNLNELKKCLKTNIPFIMFVPETEYETFPVLTEMGFDIWRWDPCMLENGGFKSTEYIAPENTIFYKLSKKVYNAATADISLQICKHTQLKQTCNAIRYLLHEVMSSDSPLNHVVLPMNKLAKMLMDLATPNGHQIDTEFYSKYSIIYDMWQAEKTYYEGSEIANRIDLVLQSIYDIFNNGEMPKSKALLKIINTGSAKNIAVVLPNRYAQKETVADYLLLNVQNKTVTVLNTSEFYNKCKAEDCTFEQIIVTFFDQAEYIKIKKTYCYNNLTYLLYDFENSWRQGFVKNVESCIQSDTLEKKARAVGFPRTKNFEWEPIKEMESVSGDIADYNFERNLVKSIIAKNNASTTLSASVECVPVVFNNDTIGYFSTSHSLIDISMLCRGELDRPEKKEVIKLKKGDIVLVRQSGKDIIYEKADELMAQSGVSALRDTTELWVDALREYATARTLDRIKDDLNKYGAGCETAQIRYWLAGETIRPDKDRVVYAISMLCPEMLPENKVKEVLDAGLKVQEFHRKAGRWLTNELKNKSREILDIYNSDSSMGHIDGIGDICIYEVEEVFEKEFVDRSKMNRLEVII